MNKILLRCFLISAAFHAFFLIIFYQNPLLLHPSSHFFAPKQKSIEELARAESDKLSKAIAIQEAMNQIAELTDRQENLHDRELDLGTVYASPQSADTKHMIDSDGQIDLIATKAYYETLDLENQLKNAPPSSLDLQSTDSVTLSLPPVTPQHELAWIGPEDPLEHNIQSEIHLDSRPRFTENNPGSEEDGKIALREEKVISPIRLDWKKNDRRTLEKVIQTQHNSRPPIQLAATTPLPFGTPKCPHQKFVIPMLELYALTLPIPVAEEWHQDFRIEVHLIGSQYESTEDTPIAVTLHPMQTSHTTKLPQNFYFLIDKSSSISKPRFEVYKKAISKALTALKPEDNFTIIFFDQKISRLSDKPIAATPKALLQAEKFLEHQEAGGMFASAELYSTLDNLFSESLEEEKVQTAILLTDGTTLLSGKKLHRALQSWVQKNHGQVSLHTATAGEGNQLLLLDLLSNLSGGYLLYSDTHAAFPRKFSKFVSTLREPIVRDIMVDGVPVSQNGTVKLLSSNRIAALYASQPMTFFLSSDQKEDITLLLQGRTKANWVRLEKTISLGQAKKAPRAIEKKWSAAQAHICYDKFLDEGKTAHLEKAKDFFKPSSISSE